MQENKKEFILSLDKLVKRWRITTNLFCGGCCFSAGQIAKVLENKGIRYQVICWQSGGSLITHFKNIVKNGYCNHVAIQVSIDRKNFIIGGDFHHWNIINRRIYYFVRSNSIIESDMIGAKLNLWNPVYNRKLNDKFINELNILVSKCNF